MNQETILQGACGIIVQEDKVLLAERAAHKYQGGRLEFPGGKLEPNELPQQAMIRELHEEIGITVTQMKFIERIEFTHPDGKVHLHVYWVQAFEGEAQGMEGQRIVWAPIAELDQYDIAEDDHRLVEKCYSLFQSAAG